MLTKNPEVKRYNSCLLTGLNRYIVEKKSDGKHFKASLIHLTSSSRPKSHRLPLLLFFRHPAVKRSRKAFSEMAALCGFLQYRTLRYRLILDQAMVQSQITP